MTHHQCAEVMFLFHTDSPHTLVTGQWDVLLLSQSLLGLMGIKAAMMVHVISHENKLLMLVSLQSKFKLFGVLQFSYTEKD